jgi:hypothetical protein
MKKIATAPISTTTAVMTPMRIRIKLVEEDGDLFPSRDEGEGVGGVGGPHRLV